MFKPNETNGGMQRNAAAAQQYAAISVELVSMLGTAATATLVGGAALIRHSEDE